MIKRFSQHLFPSPHLIILQLTGAKCFVWGFFGVGRGGLLKKKKKIVCCQRVRPLPLQPRPVHNAMSKDQLQVYIGCGGVGVSLS